MAEWPEALPLTARCLSQLGPALMAEWSKALSQTARCLSPLPGCESRPVQVTTLPVTWYLAVVFAGHSYFLHNLQLASKYSRKRAEKVMKTEIPNRMNEVTGSYLR